MTASERTSARRRPRAGVLLLGAVLALAVCGPAALPASADGVPGTADPATAVDATASPGPARVMALRLKPRHLAILSLLAEGFTVFPVRDGYDDTISITTLATSETGSPVPVVGYARIFRGSRVVETQRLDGTRPEVRWDGRDGARIRPGVYRLDVAVTGEDGTTRSTTAPITVSGARLENRIVAVRQPAGAAARVLKEPRAVQHGAQYGPVTVSVRTTASVHGRARLRLGSQSVPLPNGTHLSPAVPVDPGTTRLVVRPAWTAGTGTLVDLQVLWHFRTLSDAPGATG